VASYNTHRSIAVNPNLAILILHVPCHCGCVTSVPDDLSATKGVCAICGSVKIGGYRPDEKGGVVSFQGLCPIIFELGERLAARFIIPRSWCRTGLGGRG
jgi:hypothetical protein